MEIALLILWGITGVINLTISKPDKLSYMVIWVCFMLTLAGNAFGGNL